MTFVPGQRVSSYEILGPLGAGGMGEVFRARDTRLDREVAIKVLSEEFTGDAARLTRFEREAKALAALNHPGIVTIHSIEEEQGQRFLVMEVARGETLNRRIPDNGMPLAELLPLAVDLVTAVNAAHEAGLTHRDLKPANVLVDDEDGVKVLDFGLAKSVDVTGPDVAGDLTVEGAIVGTPAYMSPEQIQSGPVGPTSDVFSLGVLLHEMSTGKKPFQGATAVSQMASTLREQPRPVHEVKPGLPSELGRIVLKCLEKDPARRYQTCADLRVDLERLGEARAHTTSMARAVALGAAVLLVLGVLFDVGGTRSRLFHGSGTGAIRSLAVLPLESFSAEEDGEVLADGMTEALITELGRIGVERVISRRSVMRYRGSDRSLPEIASELRVDALVEGSVQRSGDQILVAARLVHGASDRLVWSDQYTRSERDVLALQRDIATAIASQIKLELAGERDSTRPVDPQAHRAYLLGRQGVEARTRAGLEKALLSFEKAIGIDPEYAAAYAALADCYLLMAAYSFAPSTEALPLGKEAAEQALKFDRGSSEAYTALGFILALYDHDWSAAEENFHKALALNFNNATAHHWYAFILGLTGRHAEAVESGRRAAELDPFSRQIRLDVANFLWASGDHERAIDEAELTLELFPSFYRAHLQVGSFYAAAGRFQEGVESIERGCALERNPMSLAELSVAYALGGRVDDARAALVELQEATGENAPAMIAAVQAALGMEEGATENLRRAYEKRDAILPILPLLSVSAALLELPYYGELEKEMGLGEE